METRFDSKAGNCRRCGGQIIKLHEEIFCLQCGARYSMDGRLSTDLTDEVKTK
ncbi:hypothetical protein ACFLUG_01305 [Chloroflexota bacterium]